MTETLQDIAATLLIIAFGVPFMMGLIVLVYPGILQ